MILDAELPNAELMAVAAAATVILSILAHGLSANPLSGIYAVARRQDSDSSAPVARS